MKMLSIIWRMVVAVPFVCVAIFGISILTIISGFQGTATFPIDCAIVFGAAVHGEDLPGPGIRRRMNTAIRLLREGSIDRIIVTGGQGAGMSVTEAAVMEEYARENGVDPALVIMETRSHSTWENLLFTHPLAKNCASIVGISDRYHLSRIRLIASIQDWDNLMTYPADVRPTPVFLIKSVLREAIAYVYYGLRLQYVIPLSSTTF